MLQCAQTAACVERICSDIQAAQEKSEADVDVGGPRENRGDREQLHARPICQRRKHLGTRSPKPPSHALHFHFATGLHATSPRSSIANKASSHRFFRQANSQTVRIFSQIMSDFITPAGQDEWMNFDGWDLDNDLDWACMLEAAAQAR